MEQQHILLLGATGASGVVFLNAVLQMSQKPRLTVYVRPGSTSKLPASAINESGIRVVEGELDNVQALTRALSASPSSAGTDPFPPVTTVISFLGAYISVKPIFTRDKSHPIADAFRTAILPTMKLFNVSRVLVLSTPTAFHYPEEAKSMPWKWWFYTWMPLIFAPQGNAEMKGIADAVMRAGSQDDRLEWTVFRVPHLNNGDANARVVAGTLDPTFAGTTELSRGSQVRWVLKEVEERKWIRRAVLLGNA